MRKLNELEGVVIGVIHKLQPCTAYSLRMELKKSPSSHWRASAGAIYPLLARLEGEGIMRSIEDADDGRGRKLLTVTPLGKKALKAWMKQIVDPDLIAEIFDPIRSRIFVLDVLAKAEQEVLTEEILGALNEYLTVTQEHLADRPASGDLFEHLGAVGGVINAKSRIALLKKVQSEIRKKPGRSKRS